MTDYSTDGVPDEMDARRSRVWRPDDVPPGSDRGNRRRALARDKMYSAMVKGRKQINAKSRDLANRAKGLRAEAGSIFSESKDSNPGEGPAA